MSKYTLKNQPKQTDTEIIFGSDCLNRLPELAGNYTQTIVIADESSAKYCLDKVKEFLPIQDPVVLPAGEISKTLTVAERVLKQLKQASLDRKSLIVGLGGGVVNDIAGFIASVYMRGIDWVMIPTTLTAQADASIGGKTGVNLAGYKNMVGSFWPPQAVLINSEFLTTLPARQLNNGLAEIIKMGFIYDKNILDHVAKLDPNSILDEELAKATELSARAKIEIVNADMYEKGERKLLNFGHTLGHGFESISLQSAKPLLHGEAIAIGMVAETKLAELEKVCDIGLSVEIANLLQKFKLPIQRPDVPASEILQIIASDKKNIGNQINWTLPTERGQGKYDYQAKINNIQTAIQSVT